jgi:ABC-2 type transport system ATP-binding protein
MNSIIEAHHLTKWYRTIGALLDCTFTIPAGKIVALVGPNGAGKSTLLHMIIGLLAPTEGDVTVMGASPQRQPERVLPHIGFVAQDHPLYRRMTVADMCAIGRSMNPYWDNALVQARFAQLNIPLDRPCGSFSGGQQAQIALTLALGKHPKLLLLDEPLASLDPLARRDFMRLLMENVATTSITVMLSSHNISDLERMCDYLIVLAGGKIRLIGDIETLTAQHKRMVGPKERAETIIQTHTLINAHVAGRQATLFIKTHGAIADPAWDIYDVSLEDLVMAYLERAQQQSHLTAIPKEEVMR